MKFSVRAAGALVLAVAPAAGAMTVWSGYDLTFTKPAFADFQSAEFQDRITPSVWLTRGDSRGVFNIAQEAEYEGAGASGPSPVGTRWALGTTAELESLTFSTWAATASFAGGPPALVGRPLVLHLVQDDIYIDIRFTDWGIRLGGSMAYERGVPAPGGAALLALAGLGGLRRRR